MKLPASHLPTGAKVTWWFLLILMTYFCVGSLPGGINNIHLFLRGQHETEVWLPAVVNVVQIIIAGFSVHAIWQLHRSGLRWLWAEVVLSGLMIVVTFLSTDAKTLVAGAISLALNTAIGLLMVSGYREVLRRHHHAQST